MRIISNFQDYYDCIQQYGADQNFVYNRVKGSQWVPSDKYAGNSYETTDGENKCIDKLLDRVQEIRDSFYRKRFFYHSFDRLNHYRMSYYPCKIRSNRREVMSEVLVGFCGNFYPALSINGNCVYDGFSFEKELRYNFKTVFDVDIDKEKKKAHSDFYKQYERFLESGLQFLGIEVIENSEPFFYFNSPIVIVRSKKVDEPDIEIDGHLATVSFYRVFDPFYAYQEISMYLSGVLGADSPETVDISDKDMKSAKGFDHNYSFKQVPNKPKRGGKAKKKQ